MSRLAAVAATALAAACATTDIPGTYEAILPAANDGGDQRPRRFLGLAGDQLVAREWDRAAWGEAGPGVLTRVFRP